VTEFGIRHNAKLKAYCERVKNIGKHTTVAEVAVIRKLLVIAHSIYKKRAEVQRGVARTYSLQNYAQSDSIVMFLGCF